MKSNETQEYFSRKCRVTDECPCLVLIHSSFSCINIRVFWGPSVWGGLHLSSSSFSEILFELLGVWVPSLNSLTPEDWGTLGGLVFQIFQVATSPKNPKDQTLCFKRRNSSFGWSSWSHRVWSKLHSRTRKAGRGNNPTKWWVGACKEYVCQRARQMPLWSTCHFVCAVWSIDLRWFVDTVDTCNRFAVVQGNFCSHGDGVAASSFFFSPQASAMASKRLELLRLWSWIRTQKMWNLKIFLKISHDFTWFHDIWAHAPRQGAWWGPQCHGAEWP